MSQEYIYKRCPDCRRAVKCIEKEGVPAYKCWECYDKAPVFEPPMPVLTLLEVKVLLASGGAIAPTYYELHPTSPTGIYLI